MDVYVTAAECGGFRLVSQEFDFEAKSIEFLMMYYRHLAQQRQSEDYPELLTSSPGLMRGGLN